MNEPLFKIKIKDNWEIVKNEKYKDEFIEVDPKHMDQRMCTDLGQIILNEMGPERHNVKSFNDFLQKLETEIQPMFRWSFEILLKPEVYKLDIFDPDFIEFKKKALVCLNKDPLYIKFKKYQAEKKKKDLSYEKYLNFLEKQDDTHKFDHSLMFVAPLPDPQDIELTPEMIKILERKISYRPLSSDKQIQRKQQYKNNQVQDYEYRYFCESQMINMEIKTPDYNKSFYLSEEVFAVVNLHMKRRIVRRLYVKTKKGYQHMVKSHEMVIPLKNYVMEFERINIMVGSALDPNRCVRRRDGLITSENDYEPKSCLYTIENNLSWDDNNNNNNNATAHSGIYGPSIVPKRSCPWKYIPQYNPHKKEEQKIEIQIKGEDIYEMKLPQQYAILPAPVSCRYVDPFDHGGE